MMTYDEFYQSADEHVGEEVTFLVRFTATRDTFTTVRLNRGKRYWVDVFDSPIMARTSGNRPQRVRISLGKP